MKTIAVDIDDVLAISARALVEFSNARWGTHLTVEDYDEDWAKMWGVDHAEESRRSDVWHTSGGIVQKQPREEGLKVLKELAKSYKLVVATSRRKIIQKDTEDWITKHFGGIFSAVHFSGIWDARTPQSHMQTKAQMCADIGADYLIDDQVKHCVGAAENGVQALLFGDYAWNRSAVLSAGVTRVNDWQAVGDFFNGRN